MIVLASQQTLSRAFLCSSVIKYFWWVCFAPPCHGAPGGSCPPLLPLSYATVTRSRGLKYDIVHRVMRTVSRAHYPGQFTKLFHWVITLSFLQAGAVARMVLMMLIDCCCFAVNPQALLQSGVLWWAGLSVCLCMAVREFATERHADKSYL